MNEVSILRRLGMTLQRDEAGTARPVPSPKSRVQSPKSETHLAWEYVTATGQSVPCSWCQTEQKVTPQAGETHGICPRHKAAILHQITAARTATPLLCRPDDGGIVEPLPIRSDRCQSLAEHNAFPKGRWT